MPLIYERKNLKSRLIVNLMRIPHNYIVRILDHIHLSVRFLSFGYQSSMGFRTITSWSLHSAEPLTA